MSVFVKIKEGENLEEVKELLKTREAINQQNSGGQTPLYLVWKKVNSVDPNVSDEKKTTFYYPLMIYLLSNSETNTKIVPKVESGDVKSFDDNDQYLADIEFFLQKPEETKQTYLQKPEETKQTYLQKPEETKQTYSQRLSSLLSRLNPFKRKPKGGKKKSSRKNKSKKSSKTNRNKTKRNKKLTK